MKPLIVLLSVFVVALLAIKIFRGVFNYRLAGRIALSSMLLFTAIGHFAFTKGMVMMLPPFIPFKYEVVYFTGIIEILAVGGILIPKLRLLTGWLLIVFFLCVLPANIYAAAMQVDYQSATYDGNGPLYLWFRIPLQILFIVWIYFFVVKD